MTIHMVISRAEAKARGLKRYFTGESCKHGHVCDRNTSDSACVECRSVMNKARPTYPWAKWSEERKASSRARIKNNQRTKRAIVAQIKIDTACSKCGFDHPAALHFHHLGGKIARVSSLVNSSSTLKRALAEMDKCVVLCANCHAIEHWNETRFRKGAA